MLVEVVNSDDVDVDVLPVLLDVDEGPGADDVLVTCVDDDVVVVGVLVLVLVTAVSQN